MITRTLLATTGAALLATGVSAQGAREFYYCKAYHTKNEPEKYYITEVFSLPQGVESSWVKVKFWGEVEAYRKAKGDARAYATDRRDCQKTESLAKAEANRKRFGVDWAKSKGRKVIVVPFSAKPGKDDFENPTTIQLR